MTAAILRDVAGDTGTHGFVSLSDLVQSGRYALVWWHPQALSPLACKTCGGGTSDALRLLQAIHEAGCDVLGLTYESPERADRYLRDIGVEYPILSVDKDAAQAHGVAKAPGESWPSIPHRVAFLVDEHLQVLNRYEVHDAVMFLRGVLGDVKAGPPVSQWPDRPRSRGWLRKLIGV